QVLDRHRRALDVPARKPDAPRARPLHLALLTVRAELPEREVGGAALFSQIDARAGPQPRQVEPREVAVVAELRRVEVDPVARSVRKALRLDALDEGDLLRNVIRRLAPNDGLEDVEPPQIIAERLGEELGDLPRGLPRTPGAGLDLVLAGVRVRGQVSHIGDVH